MSDPIKYPADRIVHTPTGPVPACPLHAIKIKALMDFMGVSTNTVLVDEGEECSNCKNEAARAAQDKPLNK